MSIAVQGGPLTLFIMNGIIYIYIYNRYNWPYKWVTGVNGPDTWVTGVKQPYSKELFNPIHNWFLDPLCMILTKLFSPG